MKTFDEAFDAALVSLTEDTMVPKNLMDQAEEIMHNERAKGWACAITDLIWESIGDEGICKHDIVGMVLTGMVSGVRIGIEMEKE